MKRLRYTDDDGRVWVTTVPDDAPDSHAQIGIPYGPPDLAGMGLPDDVSIRLHNALVDHDVLTFADFKKKRGAVLVAIRTALQIDIQALEALYFQS